MKYPIYNPYLLKNSKKYVNKALDDNWISFKGEFVKKAEEKLQELLNIKHVLLTNSGTSATHCLIKSIKWKYPECNKIYIPDNCFIAVYNVVLMEFYSRDIVVIPTDPNTLNLDLNYIDKMDYNSALFLVHNIGNIIPIDIIKKRRPDIIIVEDNCEGFMGKYDNDYSGTQSLCSSISFFANKHITCGEGGAFCTNDTKLYEFIKIFSRQGITNIKYKYNILGHNYRLSNINAAVLFSQINYLEEIINKKKIIFKMYEKYLKNVDFSIKHPNTEHSYWMFCIKFKKQINFNHFETYMKENNIEIRQFFFHYKEHNHLQNLKMIENVNHKLENYVVILPSYPDLNETEIKYISFRVNNYNDLYIQI